MRILKMIGVRLAVLLLVIPAAIVTPFGWIRRKHGRNIID